MCIRDRDGRELFKKLISVSGVGPKVAMGILSVHSSRDVVWAIIGEDGTTLSKAPGIGKKISQRIILELKDKLVKEQEQFNLEEPIVNSISRLGNRQEAIDALVSVSYTHLDVYKRQIKISPQVEKAIRAYLTARGETDEKAPLFSSTSNNNRGARLTTRSVSGIVKTRLRQAGYDSPRLTAHSLRHTAVTLSLLAGKDIAEVQQFARHANIATTMIYNHAIDKLSLIHI